MSHLQNDLDQLACGQPDPARLHALQRMLPRPDVQAVLRQTGHDAHFCPRLPAWFMVWFVIGLGLFSRQSYRSLFRCLQPRRLLPTPCRAALCMARRRLGCGVLRRLARRTLKPLANSTTPGAFYAGMRLLALDGFVLSVPDTPANAAAFGYPANQRTKRTAFPQVRVVALCEVGTHVLLDWLVKPSRRAECRMAPTVLRSLPAGALLLWDRHYFSYDALTWVRSRHAQLLARLARGVKPQIVRELSDGSLLVRIKPSHRSHHPKATPHTVRLIRYRLGDATRGKPHEEHRLVTTLLDEKAHPAATLVTLYHERWEEELTIDEVKTHLAERPVLRSQAPAGVVQEVYGLLLGHYVVRRLMFEAATETGLPPRRLSFVGALHILRCRLAEAPRSGRGLRAWYRRLRVEVREEVLPPRRDRIHARVIKQPRQKWPAKQDKHRHPPPPTRPFRDIIVILR